MKKTKSCLSLIIRGTFLGKKYFLIFTLLIFLSSSLLGQQPEIKKSELNPDYVKYLEDLRTGRVERFTSDGHALGYIPPPYKFEPEIPANFNKDRDLPDYYDLRDYNYLTPVKDQGNCGSCWAFATYGSVESRWLELGLGAYDLSENNLIYGHGFVSLPCAGGNENKSTAYLARGSGPISEADDPYQGAGGSYHPGLTPQAYISDARFLPNNMDVSKQTIYDSGAVFTMMYWNPAYYNATDFTYYYSGVENCNHAVILVGWDDNKVTTGGTGAWILRNSWGTSWGENGFFYISYNDSKVNTNTAYWPNRLNYDSSSVFHYYDKLGSISNVGFGDSQDYALVKYEVSEAQQITKIGTWVCSSNSTVGFDIYGDFDGSSLSNYIGSIGDQSCSYPGYYTFDLSTAINLSDGDNIYIKANYNTPGYDYPIPIECYYEGYADPFIESGKCWFSNTGVNASWISMGSDTDYQWDLCIKLYGIALQANFTATPTSGYAPLTVNFTDLSTGSPTSFEWDFQNDGTIDSYVQNPEWIYNETGTYTVSLTVSDGTNTDTEIKTDYISVSVLEPPTNLSVTELGYATWEPPAGMREMIFYDDFESYNVGEYLAVQSSEWTTWSNAPGSSEDAYVSDEQALSGTKSVKVEGTQTDLVHEYGNLTTGHYLVTHNFYVVSGYGGYYNLLHNFAGGNYEWGFEAFFAVNGTGYISAGGANAATFTYTPASWTECVVDIDLDNDLAIFFVNDVQIYEWQWSLKAHDGAPGMCQLGATDIYAHAPPGENAMYYFDDLSLAEADYELLGYNIYLDDTYVDFTENLFWQYSDLTPGTTYLAGVSALYDEDESNIIEESFTYIQLNADFLATPLSGNAPLTVNFTDLSTGAPTSWEWDFDNDCTIDSYIQNPEWIYNEQGTYTVSLTVSDGTNTDTEIKTDYISVGYVDDGIKKVLSDVAIDGMLEESFWEITEQITIANNGSSDNIAYFGVLWDDDYLYIGVNVIDGTLCTNGRQGWYDDGVEICIDGNYNQGTDFDDHDRQFIKPINSYWIQEMNGNNEDVLHKWMLTDDGYSMEFAIPWTNFDIIPAAGDSIGFNVVVNDDDNCDNVSNLPSQLLWNGNGNYYQNPSLWGVIILSDQTVSYSGDYIGIIDPNGEDFLINNKSFEINWVSSGIDNVDIEYSTDNGTNWDLIASNISAGSGSYSWNVIATASEQCKIRISNSNNPSFYDISESPFTISAVLTTVGPLIPNEWDNYQWPYNAYFPEDPGGINGHVGNACGHSSLARILHYWEFPIVGNDELTFTDVGGHTWSANFGETTYNYDNMPDYLPENSTEEEYTDVATLFYHAATSMHDIYGSGGNLDNMSYAMSHYFNYKESTETLRKNYTRAEWIQIMKNEFDNGRVLLVCGMTLEAPGGWHESNWVAGHWYHCDGYNDDGEFHVVVGYGDEDGYYDAESLSGFAYNIGILTGLEPDLNGKELSLQSHNGGEIICAGEETDIIWTSNNVSDIKIEYTLDNGENWLEIIASTPASTGTYTWTVPDTTSHQCKVKLTDVTDINVYDKSDDVFSIVTYELTLLSPNGGEFFISGDFTSISWENTPVSNIKIEYSTDNGLNWIEINASTSAASGSYDWIIPNEISNQCLVKISDVSDPAVFDESDNTFEIGLPNNAGGPYAVDDNTVLLFHFNGNLNEEAFNYAVNDHGIAKSYIESPVSGLSDAIYFDNSIQANQSFITIPHSGELSMSNNWTIEFWLCINTWGQSHNNWAVPIILPTTAWNANYYLEIPASMGKLKYGFSTSEGGITIYSSPNSITTGTWYHVALINDYDNHTIKLILHDVDFQELEEQSESYTAGTTISTGTEDLRIGAGLFGDNYFDGYMDEVRISDVVRSFEDELHADFSATPFSGDAPLTVNFTDLSTGAPTSWEWDFDNDCTIDSYDQNPEWIYTEQGTYTVSLTVSDGTDTNTETKADYITVGEPIIADFEAIPTEGLLPLDVQFTDLSTGGLPAIMRESKNLNNSKNAENDNSRDIVSWEWDFDNDGTVDSNEQNPLFIYTEAGTYTVSLTVSDGTNTDTEIKTDYITVGEPIVADFEAIPTEGLLPLDVQFTDLSIGGLPAFMRESKNLNNSKNAENDNSRDIVSWEWDFDNDGTIDSYEQDPTHTYSEAGTYTVSLTVSDGSNSDEEIKVDYITVGEPIVADFEATPTEGLVPLNVQFTDLSTGGLPASMRESKNLNNSIILENDNSRDIVSWEWDFNNDGTVDSNEQNPLFIYTEAGTYTVSLTVSDGTNTDTEIKIDFISVSGDPALDPPSNLAVTEQGFATWEPPDEGDDFYEDFEGTFPPDGWLKLNPDGGTGWEPLELGTSPLPGWADGEATACPDGGNWQAFCTWTTGGATSNDQWLVTPQLTVQAGDILDFWMIYYFDSYMDHVEVLISTTVQNDPAAFDIVVAEIDFPDGSPTVWTEYTYNLTDFVAAGTDVYIGFRETVADNWNDGSAISIDNVLVGTPAEQTSPVVHFEQPVKVTKNINYVHVPATHVVETRVLIGYKVYLDGVYVDFTTNLFWQYSGLLSGTTYLAGVSALYDEGESNIIEEPFTYIQLTADFTADITSGIAPLMVDFTDLSTGVPTSWEWDFQNDGTIDSYEQDPTHTYSEAGTYTVSLTVSDGLNSDEEIKVDYITVGEPIVADFSANPTEGLVPLDVQFTDLSTGGLPASMRESKNLNNSKNAENDNSRDIISWEWDFDNDGTIDSYEQNPLFTYTEAGLYTVSLTVSDGSNTDTETKVDYITVGEPIVADFEAIPTEGLLPLEVQFTDLSTGGLPALVRESKNLNNSRIVENDNSRDIVSWEWDFDNDGTIDSYEQNPLFTYTEVGIYTVSLTVSDGTNTDTEIKIDYISVSGGPALEPPTNLSVTEQGFATWEPPDEGDDFYEDFEGTFPPDGWLKLNPDGGTGWEPLELGTTPLPGWTGGEATACPDGGNWQAFCTWTTGGATGNDQWLVTPQLTVQAGDMLDFWIIYYFDSYMDYVEVLISTTVQNDPAAFDVVVAEIDFPVGSSTNWTEYTYNLTDFVAAGTSVYIAFREIVADNYNDGSAISIDNVLVGTPTEQTAPVVHFEQPVNVTKNINYVHFSATHIVETRELTGYKVYLDGVYVDFTINLFWQYSDLTTETTYLAGVSALYDEGESNIIEEPFTYIQFTADFTADITSGIAPLTVNFTDLSTGTPTSWEWDFQNDGTIDSYEHNPEWIYTEQGTYTVSLTVSDGTNSDTETKVDYITVSEPIVADFSANPTEGLLPLDVQFTDLSTGGLPASMRESKNLNNSRIIENDNSRDIVSWEWDFDNDGTIDSYEQNPLFTYTEAGLYTVSLTVSDGLNSDEEIKVDYITVGEPIVADFSANPTEGLLPLDVQFTDLSTGGLPALVRESKNLNNSRIVENDNSRDIVSWEWDFDNDSTIDSYEQNPTYTYTEAGLYTVTLTVSDGSNTDMETKVDYITVGEPIIADFEATPTEGLLPLEVQFTDLSTGGLPALMRESKNLNNSIILENDNSRDIVSWEWDFDNDGTIDSYEQNPIYTYTDEGLYTVSLTISDGTNFDTEIKEDYISVSLSDVQNEIIPLKTELIGNHPNPFNPETVISYNLSAIDAQQEIRIVIFNLQGRKLKELVSNHLSVGMQSVIWDGTDDNNKMVTSGVYFYKLNVNGKTEAVKKCILLK